MQPGANADLLTHQSLKLTIVSVKIYNFFNNLSQSKSVKAIVCGFLFFVPVRESVNLKIRYLLLPNSSIWMQIETRRTWERNSKKSFRKSNHSKAGLGVCMYYMSRWGPYKLVPGREDHNYNQQKHVRTRTHTHTHTRTHAHTHTHTNARTHTHHAHRERERERERETQRIRPLQWVAKAAPRELYQANRSGPTHYNLSSIPPPPPFPSPPPSLPPLCVYGQLYRFLPPDQGCQELVTGKGQNLFKKGQMLDFTK